VKKRPRVRPWIRPRAMASAARPAGDEGDGDEDRDGPARRVEQVGEGREQARRGAAQGHAGAADPALAVERVVEGAAVSPAAGLLEGRGQVDQAELDEGAEGGDRDRAPAGAALLLDDLLARAGAIVELFCALLVAGGERRAEGVEREAAAAGEEEGEEEQGDRRVVAGVLEEDVAAGQADQREQGEGVDDARLVADEEEQVDAGDEAEGEGVLARGGERVEEAPHLAHCCAG
jgi:hypothetical protein